MAEQHRPTNDDAHAIRKDPKRYHCKTNGALLRNLNVYILAKISDMLVIIWCNDNLLFVRRLFLS